MRRQQVKPSMPTTIRRMISQSYHAQYFIRDGCPSRVADDATHGRALKNADSRVLQDVRCHKVHAQRRAEPLLWYG
jgi:hypothetical protein